MGIVAGRYGTSTVYGGSYYGRQEEWIPAEVTFLRADLRYLFENPVESGLWQQPWGCNVTVRNLVSSQSVALDGIVSVSMTKSSDETGDSFTIVLDDAIKWSPDGTQRPGWLVEGSPDRRYDVDLVLNLQGSDVTFQAFRGYSTRIEEQYEPRTGQSTLTITGSTTREKLRTTAPPTAPFSGSLGFWLAQTAQAGGQHVWAAIEDGLVQDPQEMMSSTLLGSIRDFHQRFPLIDIMYAPPFVLQLRDGSVVTPPGGILPGQHFQYRADRNITHVKVVRDPGKLQNDVNVTGGNASGSGIVLDIPLLTQYGYRPGSVGSNLVLDGTVRDQVGQDKIKRSTRRLRTLDVTAATLNPLLDPDDSVTLTGLAGEWWSGRTMKVRSCSTTLTRQNGLGTFTFQGDVE